jgi:hypothetical protein
MNNEQNNIEQYKILLFAKLESNNLSLREDEINKFLEFIIENLPEDSSNETIIQRLELLTYNDIRNLEEQFIKDVEFNNLITKSFQIEKRKQLKESIKELDKDSEDFEFDINISKAFQIEKRQELKRNLKLIDKNTESKPRWIITKRPYLKALSIAASILLFIGIWQPQHFSDKKLYSDYLNNLDNNSIADYTKTDIVIEQNGLRGEEVHFRNYNDIETKQLLEAIAYVKQKKFEYALEIFNTHHIVKEKNPGLALYLSIAQLNTDNLSDAILNLEYLTKLSVFLYNDESKFHLVYAYLKLGERSKAKELLNELASSQSNFSDQAKITLDKIRWF